MEADVGERNNLFTKKPKVAKHLLQLLEEDVNAGRSTEGAKSVNDFADIVLWKSGR